MESQIHQIDSVDSATDWHLVRSLREVYVQDCQVKISLWGAECQDLSLTMLDNAQKVGAECARFHFSPTRGAGFSALCGVLRAVDFSLRDLVQVLAAADFERGPVEVFGVSVTCSMEPAIRVFSPFHMDRLKPLDKMPKKWTVRHALRAIVNGQYEGFRCTGVMTDDYARDNERNFGRGEFKAPLLFVRRVIESPSGWRVYAEGNNRVALNCHSFDCNELRVKLEASRAA
jgi:hypothetical protein